VTVVAQGRKTVRRIFSKAPIRDLVLGAATIVALVIIGVQTKLLVNSSKTDVSDSAPSVVAPQLMKSAQATPTVAVPAPAQSPAPKTAAKKSSAKTPREPKQIVVPKQVVVPTSTLDLAIQHQFKDATFYVWIDDRLELTRALHGGAQKKLVVFN